MNLLAALRSALRALATNRLRSMLTMLGIIIGVAAVITMIAIGGGAQKRVEEQIKSLGTNIMLVLPGAVTTGGVRLGAQTGQSADRGGRARPSPSRCPRCRPPRPACAPARRWWRPTPTGAPRCSAPRPTTSRCATGRSPTGAASRTAEMAGSGKVAVLGQTVAQRAVRRRRPDRPDDPRAQGAAAGDRRARAQGPELDGPGPGRRRRRAAVHLPQPHAGHERRAAEARRGRSASRCATARACRRPSDKHPRAAAPAPPRCSPARTTTSASAT